MNLWRALVPRLLQEVLLNPGVPASCSSLGTWPGLALATELSVAPVTFLARSFCPFYISQ